MTLKLRGRDRLLVLASAALAAALSSVSYCVRGDLRGDLVGVLVGDLDLEVCRRCALPTSASKYAVSAAAGLTVFTTSMLSNKIPPGATLASSLPPDPLNFPLSSWDMSRFIPALVVTRTFDSGDAAATRSCYWQVPPLLGAATAGQDTSRSRQLSQRAPLPHC